MALTQATCLGVGSGGRCAPGAGLARPACQRRRQRRGRPGFTVTAPPAACRTRNRSSPALHASQTDITETQTEEPEERLSLELPTVDVQAAVRLMAVQQGRGTAIVVSAVDPGSQAAAAGVRVGQQLLEVSDPIRFADTWQLNERASLRYVRECIRMRRDAVMQLVLTGQPIPEWQEAVAAARAAALEAQQPQQEQLAADAITASQDGDDLLSAIVNAAVAGTTSSDESDSEAEAAGRPLTMADKLEQQYQQQQVEAAAEARLVQQQMTALQQRQARRRERLEVDDQRNDSKFFAFVAMFFVLPPLIILGVAFGTGYLDSLDPYASMR